MNQLSGTQKFIKLFVPSSLFASMEAESRSWMVKCSNCNHERSIWELGGIRWGAAGNPKRKQLCPNCMQMNWHTVYKKQ